MSMLNNFFDLRRSPTIRIVKAVFGYPSYFIGNLIEENRIEGSRYTNYHYNCMNHASSINPYKQKGLI